MFWGSVAAQAFNSASFGKGLSRSLSTAHLKVGAVYTTWCVQTVGGSHHIAENALIWEMLSACMYSRVAPEPLNRKAYMDDADVYAFGLVLYSILTGGNPPARTEQDEFQFKNLEELKKKIPDDAPAELWELVCLLFVNVNWTFPSPQPCVSFTDGQVYKQQSQDSPYL